MDIKEIKALAEILRKNNLSAVEVSENGRKIRLEKNHSKEASSCFEGSAYKETQPPVLKIRNEQGEAGAINYNSIKEVKSPMVGVFYASPGPETEPFVGIGSKVKTGDVLCIIEAMKLMNEITADEDGEIADICVENGQVVEFSQVLFKIY